MNVSCKTLSILETADRKEQFICGYPSSQVKRDFFTLTKGDSVEVGYRAGCGRMDNTHLVFKEWLKVIKQLKKDGFTIKEVNVTHENKSPTLSNGYWNSVIYSIQ